MTGAFFLVVVGVFCFILLWNPDLKKIFIHNERCQPLPKMQHLKCEYNLGLEQLPFDMFYQNVSKVFFNKNNKVILLSKRKAVIFENGQRGLRYNVVRPYNWKASVYFFFFFFFVFVTPTCGMLFTWSQLFYWKLSIINCKRLV